MKGSPQAIAVHDAARRGRPVASAHQIKGSVQERGVDGGELLDLVDRDGRVIVEGLADGP